MKGDHVHVVVNVRHVDVLPAQPAGVPVAVNRVGSMVGLFFVREQGKQVLNYAHATGSDTARYATFFHAMLENGVYLAPSQYEALFVGLAHDDKAIDQTIDAAAKAFKASRASDS